MIIQIYKNHEICDTLYAIKKIWECCEKIYFENDNQQLFVFNARSIEFHVIF